MIQKNEVTHIIPSKQENPFLKCQCAIVEDGAEDAEVVELADSLRRAAKKLLGTLKTDAAQEGAVRNALSGLISRRSFQVL